MNMSDPSAIADQMFDAVKAFVARSLRPLIDRVTAAEKTLADKVDATFVRSVVDARVAEIPAGKDGRDGVNGKDGADGLAGKDGLDGKDAVPVDIDGLREEIRQSVDNVLAEVATVDKAVLNVAQRLGAIETRDPPSDGKDGAPGERGESGPRGEKGERGDIGEKGMDGIAGKDGAEGRDGRDGKEGPAGRDALKLDVLDGIDPTRAYVRGTYATHRGGIVHAFRSTEPLDECGGELERAGWHVVIAGIAEMAVELAADGRTVNLTMQRTGGRVETRSVRIPAVLYRDVWKPGTYEHGDVVTRDGSTWHCNETTEAQPGDPAGAKAWTLAVKRGRDGKDGVLKEPSEPGPVRLR